MRTMWRRVDGNFNRLFLDPLFKGSYPPDMLEHYQGCAPGFSVIRDSDLGIISQPIDFLGINFYTPVTVTSQSGTADASSAGYCVLPVEKDPVLSDLHAVAVSRPGFPRTEMDWEVESAALTELLTRIHTEYRAVPIMITENGAAYGDYVAPDGRVRDPERVAYLDGHLRAALRAREAGVDVRGYFVWSLLDNFEWALGYSKRFGLVWVDYPSGTRIPKDSFRWYRETLKAKALMPVPETMARLGR